ncbi:HD domain-containing protein [Tsuneonella sp. SYSU-LHT278]|uniref:HD domain-containing protein n=1 Tax=Tsuneonella sediminis TaxID=3416089 RepID=UPI003F7AAE93
MNMPGSSRPDDIVRLLDAAHFAAEKHRNCRRKDAGATPYINHPLRVAQVLAEEGIREVDVLMAALLHDTVEDTETTTEELRARFGATVAGLVAEVTDDKALDKQVRKDLQVLKAPNKSDRAKLIKIADKISNLEDLVARPPDWPRERIEQYREWASRVIAGCSGVNGKLDARALALCTECKPHGAEGADRGKGAVGLAAG